LLITKILAKILKAPKIPKKILKIRITVIRKTIIKRIVTKKTIIKKIITKIISANVFIIILN